MRGLDKLRAEFSLTALAYNLRRAITPIGVPRLIRVVRARDGHSKCVVFTPDSPPYRPS